MDAAIVRLRGCLGELLSYYPHVLRNVFEPEPSLLGAPEPSQQQLQDPSAVADIIEGFLTELTRVLSIGIRDDNLGLWSVLELLECVPDRMQAVAEATAAATQTAVLGEDRTRGPLQELQRFRFASQLVYVVRSTFPAASHALRTRILLRLTLNQGCLLAALELLREWCRQELLAFYAASDRGCSNSVVGSVPSEALLVQPDSGSDVWNSFVAAIAPVAGPPVAEIAAGAPKLAAQPFHLQLLVSGLDDSSAASRAYYTQVQSYVYGRRPTRPSALVCYRAALQQQSNTVRKDGDSARSPSKSEDAVFSPQISPHPAEQFALGVESLPVDCRTASSKAAAPVPKGNMSYGSSSTLSSLLITQGSSSSVRDGRVRGTKKRRRRRPSLHTTDSEAAVHAEDAAVPPMLSADKTGNSTSDNTCSIEETAVNSSTVVADVRKCQDAPEAVEEVAASYKQDDVLQKADPQVIPAADETGVTEAASKALDTASIDLPAAAFSNLSPALCASKLPFMNLDSSSAPAPSSELTDLRHSLWLCWFAVMTHAESVERSRITLHDVDANTL
ncbi:hypothetical protein MNV84_04253 [Leishmania braziliensis]|nr:hypothetical protein MNV84_04253 [Leishmania braziliensis]